MTAALRRLDACALLDVTAAARTGMGNRSAVTPDGPHVCTLANARFGGDEIKISLGTEYSRELRHRAKPLDLDGVKAYADYPFAADPSDCTVNIPVSFTRSIRVLSRTADDVTDDASCRRAEEFARQAIRTLNAADPAPVPFPLAKWDACGILKGVIAPDAPKLTYGNDNLGLDGCDTELEQEKDIAGLTQTPDLRIMYDTDPLTAKNTDFRPVRDRKVAVTKLGSACRVKWGQGPSGLDGATNNTVVMELAADSCDHGLDFAGRIMDLLRNDPPQEAAHQQPLTFAVDEPDQPAVGACADWPTDPDIAPCLPPRPVQAPEGGKALLEQADPSTACAFAEAAVKDIFGPELRPVLYGDYCKFVEPSHERIVSVMIAPDEAARDYAGDPRTDKDVRETSIGGIPAVSYRSEARPGLAITYNIYLAASGSAGEPGTVGLELTVEPPRGAPDSTSADSAHLTKLDELATALSARLG